MRNQKVERLSQGPGKTLKFVFFLRWFSRFSFSVVAEGRRVRKLKAQKENRTSNDL